jgi:hypothetical protein
LKPGRSGHKTKITVLNLRERRKDHEEGKESIQGLD